VDGFDLVSMEILVPVLIGMAALLLFRAMPRLMAGGVPLVAPSVLREHLDRGDDVLVVDVRTPGEYAGRHGHVPGALNLPLDQLGRRVEEAGPGLSAYADTPVFLICQTSSRAAHAARILKKAGFQQLAVVSGGMSAWRAQGHPTQHGDAA